MINSQITDVQSKWVFYQINSIQITIVLITHKKANLLCFPVLCFTRTLSLVCIMQGCFRTNTIFQIGLERERDNFTIKV